eukprot:1157707-Pelagomonas_calceolata.AAC.12
MLPFFKAESMQTTHEAHTYPLRFALLSPTVGPIISLSTGSDTVMEFRSGADHRPLLLPRRSLLVLTGEARLLQVTALCVHQVQQLTFI